jgi:biopolymer transport protein ExbD
MRTEVVRRRRKPVSMTSLIDVIFLLLLFFMLSSTFTRFAEVEFSAGRAGAMAPGTVPDVLLRLSDGTWSVNGIASDEDGGIAELRRLEEAGARTAVLLVRSEMTSQDLVSAVERVRRETGLALSVAR